MTTRPPLSSRLGTARSWHLWLSVALSLPILIVAVTAIFIAHGKALGLNEMAWPSGTAPAHSPMAAAELRQLQVGADGAVWLATKQGLLVQRGDTVTPVPDLAELRVLAAGNGFMLAAGKYGLFRIDTQSTLPQAQALMQGDFWGVARTPAGWVAHTKARVYEAGPDAHTFQPSDAYQPLLAGAAQALPPERMTMQKLVMDLHTGKFFFGSAFEWIWIDLVGAVMALLTVTGLLMWWRGQRRKAAALDAQLAASAGAEPRAAPALDQPRPAA